MFSGRYTYRSALEVRTRTELPQDWAATQYNLENALQELGTSTGTINRPSSSAAAIQNVRR
jgi:hypothetical protein